MQALYQESGFTDLKKQISKRQLLVLSVIILFLAALVLVLAADNHKDHRPELPATLIVILGGSLAVFIWDLTVKPLRSYARHMDAALHGRTHQEAFVFDRISSEDSVIDGVTYRDLVFLGDADKHGDRERMFYWDMEKPIPAFRKGQPVRLSYYDRFIIGYEAL